MCIGDGAVVVVDVADEYVAGVDASVAAATAVAAAAAAADVADVADSSLFAALLCLLLAALI